MVMDRADGLPLLAGLAGGGAIKELPKIAKRMPAVLGRAMARLHRFDPEPVRQELENAGVLPGDIVEHLLTAAELWAALTWSTQPDGSSNIAPR
jgi:hypothetical protein